MELHARMFRVAELERLVVNCMRRMSFKKKPWSDLGERKGGKYMVDYCLQEGHFSLKTM